jgi:hypothetical protein
MVLPARPLQLKSSFVWLNRLLGIGLVLAGLAAGVGYAWWQYDAVRELWEQSQIWAVGVPALSTTVGGEVKTSRAIFHEYKLEVHYVDALGVTHEHKLEFDTLGGAVDQDREAMVHYLEADPDRFALSWAVDVKTSRWASIAFLGLVGVGLIGGSLFFFGGVAWRTLSAAQRCAHRSDEVIVRITRVVAQTNKGKHDADVYHYAGETIDGRVVTGNVLFSLKHGPLYADPAHQTMVALVAPENLKRPVIVHDDFHPFVLRDTEEAEVRSAIAARAAVPAKPAN